jgi:hypothetical protein
MADADITQWTGEDINAYLNELDSNRNVRLSDWEATFVGSNLGRTSFTPAQRRVITDLVRKYGDDLN